MFDDSYWMLQALKLAEFAKEQDEVPVGAIVVLDNNIIGSGWNQPIVQKDPTAHAEVIALREAAKNLNNYRILNATLYVTLEPCAMCVGAMLYARIKHLVFGAYDAKAGAVNSIFSLLDNATLNHRISYQGGILSKECAEMLTNFFKQRR